ncbi:MAG: type III pantothenate kinase [Bacteroidota bacterium]
MKVVIDIGNTDIVLAAKVDGIWLPHFRHPTAEVDTWNLSLSQALETWGNPSSIEQQIVSSVVPAATPKLVEHVTAEHGPAPLVLGKEHFRRLGIRHAEEIGSDLVANAYAAYDRFQTACVAVDFGTALTFTVVDAQGEIAGVNIAPGLKTAVKALFQNAAQLPEIPLEYPSSALGQNTTHAIQAGILIGYVGLVKEMLTNIEQEMGQTVHSIATGGLARIIPPLQDVFDEIDSLLTLDGLLLLGKHFA